MSNHYQDDETRDWYKATWKSLFWVILLSACVRVPFLVATRGNLQRDPDAYRKLAVNVLETGVYGWKTERTPRGVDAANGGMRPTAFRPPLYPIVLLGIGGTQSIWPIAGLHLLLGVGTVGLVACLGWRFGLGGWSVAAAMLVALDPILLQQSTLVMTETLATFLATLTLFCLTYDRAKSHSNWLAASWPSALTGVALGLCVLCRPTFLPWLGLIALTQLGPWRRLSGGRSSKNLSRSDQSQGERPLSSRLVRVTVLTVAALLVIMPWVIRNQMVMGKAKLTTTHGGYTVLLGNNPLFYRFLKSHASGTWDGEQLSRAWKGRSLTTGCDDAQWDDLPQLARRAEHLTLEDGSEFSDDELAYQLARRYIRAQPAMFVYASGLRITRLWRLLPHRVEGAESPRRWAMRCAVGVWYALVMGLAICGLGSLGRSVFQTPWLYGLQLCVVFTAVHTLYWSDMRMRAPLMPLVCLAAAQGMASLCGCLRYRKS